MEEELSTTTTFIGNLCCEVKKGDEDLEDTSSAPRTLSFNLAEVSKVQSCIKKYEVVASLAGKTG